MSTVELDLVVIEADETKLNAPLGLGWLFEIMKLIMLKMFLKRKKIL